MKYLLCLLILTSCGSPTPREDACVDLAVHVAGCPAATAGEKAVAEAVLVTEGGP